VQHFPYSLVPKCHGSDGLLSFLLGWTTGPNKNDVSVRAGNSDGCDKQGTGGCSSKLRCQLPSSAKFGETLVQFALWICLFFVRLAWPGCTPYDFRLSLVVTQNIYMANKIPGGNCDGYGVLNMWTAGL
jgi:hypothetical protein